ncbi:unnamed protein product [Brachionus calyciflorus]|uniref:Uncharacterized protein n=1 Tax=Brachionus calyciflorus TaxID=104777 RepID=A0A814G0R4_9BILA|nr:unnamed protein product [Brachionus calyciflorus]
MHPNYKTNILYDKTILIDRFSTISRLFCIKKCISLDSSCQFFEFTSSKICTIFSSFNKENFLWENEIHLREKKLPRIHFLNGSFVERSQLLSSVSFNLSRNGINLIAPFVFENSNRTTTLDLSFNNLTLIYSNSFYGMINLKTLNLRFNQISQLESDAFKELPSLADLQLGYNSLRYLNGNIFDNLQSLQEINLEFNQIESIERYTFKNLNKLWKISLNNNFLKLLEPIFYNLSAFRILDVSSNQIIFIHNDTFKTFDNLKDILISENEILEINSETFKGASGLERLFINSNKIKKIDEKFTQNVANLIHLDISKNNLSLIETKIFNNLTELQTLNLDFCNLKEINLNTLAKLKYLFLRNNFINFFSQNLGSLLELRLTSNPLGNLTYPLITSPNSALTALGISYCQLKYIDFDVLRNYPNLKFLNIAWNPLNLSNDTFNGFKSLMKVFLKADDFNRFRILYPNITFEIS